MLAPAPAPRRIEVELPGEAFSRQPCEPGRVADELRLLWLLEQVRRRNLGFGKAAELAGLPTARFLELMAEHRISPFDFEPDELQRELA